MKRLLIAVMFGFCALAGHAQGIPSGSKVFVAPMEGNLDGFITAEILKQHVKVLVVADDKDADYVMTGLSLKQDDHWYNTAWGGKDKNEANVQLIQVQNKAIVWAMDAGDRSILLPHFRKGGLSKVAERIVDGMKHQVAK